MEVIYTYLKININSYRTRISIFIRWLLKIIKFRDVENQSYLPNLSIGILQYGVQPRLTEKGSALNLFHQQVCCCIKKQKERLCPSSLNFVRSKQLMEGGEGCSDHTVAGVQVFEIILSWVNDSKEQILFLISLQLPKGLSNNIVCEHPSCSISLHENYLPLQQLIKHSHQLENDISKGARPQHQTCFLTATCTSELLHSVVNHTCIRMSHRCMPRAGLDPCSASPHSPEQAIHPSCHLSFCDE